MRRRHFLQLAAGAAAGVWVGHAASQQTSVPPVELAPGVMVRASHGRTATVSVTNAAARPANAQSLGVSGWITPGEPDELIHILLENRPAEPWSYSQMEFPGLRPRKQYRLRIMNATASDIPVYLPGHRVALTRLQQTPVSGIFADTLRVARYSVVEADLIAIL